MTPERRPFTVPIGGRKLRVVFRDCEDFACYHHDEGKIVIRRGLDDATYLDSLAHELLHATLSISGVGYGLAEGQEEQIVRAFEQLFFPVFRKLLAEPKKPREKKAKKEPIST